MSATVLAFPVPTVHLWMHPTSGGWVGVIAGKVDPDWPHPSAEWVPSSSGARERAFDLQDQRRLALRVHSGSDF